MQLVCCSWYINDSSSTSHSNETARSTMTASTHAASGLHNSGCSSFFVTSCSLQPERNSSWQKQVSFGKAGPLVAEFAPFQRMPARDGAKVSLKARPEPMQSEEGQRVPVLVKVCVCLSRAKPTCSFGKAGPLFSLK